MICGSGRPPWPQNGTWTLAFSRKNYGKNHDIREKAKKRKREVEEESGWGEQVRKDWNEMEVKDVEHWMHLVENKTWLSRKIKTMSSAGDDGGMTREGEEDEADE